MMKFVACVALTYEETFPTDRSHNTCPPDLQQAIKYIFDNPEMQHEMGNLRSLYFNKKECLIHGDLHDGSVMVNEGFSKVFPFSS